MFMNLKRIPYITILRKTRMYSSLFVNIKSLKVRSMSYYKLLSNHSPVTSRTSYYNVYNYKLLDE